LGNGGLSCGRRLLCLLVGPRGSLCRPANPGRRLARPYRGLRVRAPLSGRLRRRRPSVVLAGYARAVVVVHLIPPLALPFVEELSVAPRCPVSVSGSAGGRVDPPGLTTPVRPPPAYGLSAEDAGGARDLRLGRRGGAVRIKRVLPTGGRSRAGAVLVRLFAARRWWWGKCGALHPCHVSWRGPQPYRARCLQRGPWAAGRGHRARERSQGRARHRRQGRRRGLGAGAPASGDASVQRRQAGFAVGVERVPGGGAESFIASSATTLGRVRTDVWAVAIGRPSGGLRAARWGWPTCAGRTGARTFQVCGSKLSTWGWRASFHPRIDPLTCGFP
jgi:hypothetical protein